MQKAKIGFLRAGISLFVLKIKDSPLNIKNSTSDEVLFKPMKICFL